MSIPTNVAGRTIQVSPPPGVPEQAAPVSGDRQLVAVGPGGKRLISSLADLRPGESLEDQPRAVYG